MRNLLGNLGCRLVCSVTYVGGALQVAELDGYDVALLDACNDRFPIFLVASRLVDRNVPFAFLMHRSKPPMLMRFQEIPILLKPVSTSALECWLRTVRP